MQSLFETIYFDTILHLGEKWYFIPEGFTWIHLAFVSCFKCLIVFICSLQALSESSEKLTEHYWEEIKSHSENSHSEEIVYAAGLPLKNKDFKITEGFSLSTLHTILEKSSQILPGVSYPFMYFGAKHASFPWHIEDGALFSANFLYYGAPCVWWVIIFYWVSYQHIHFM